MVASVQWALEHRSLPGRRLQSNLPIGAIPQGPNQRWSLDFVSDSLSCGRRFRILNVIDDLSRECLAAVVDTSLSGDRVVRELDRIAEMRGYPCLGVSDNGTELTSNAILKWQKDRKVEWHYIAPGKPMRDTASSRASMAASATSALTSTCSPTVVHWARTNGAFNGRPCQSTHLGLAQ